MFLCSSIKYFVKRERPPIFTASYHVNSPVNFDKLRKMGETEGV